MSPYEENQIVIGNKCGFHMVRVRNKTFPNNQIISEAKFKTDWGISYTFWVKTKDIKIEGNHIGFCLN